MSTNRLFSPLPTDAYPQFAEVNIGEAGVDKGLVRIRRFDLRSHQLPRSVGLILLMFFCFQHLASGYSLAVGSSVFIKVVGSLENHKEELTDIETC